MQKKRRKSTGRRVSFAPEHELETKYIFAQEGSDSHSEQISSPLRATLEKFNQTQSNNAVSPSTFRAQFVDSPGVTMDITNNAEVQQPPHAHTDIHRPVSGTSELQKYLAQQDVRAVAGLVEDMDITLNVTANVPKLSRLLDEEEDAVARSQALPPQANPESANVTLPMELETATVPALNTDTLGFGGYLQAGAHPVWGQQADRTAALTEELGPAASQLEKWGFAPGVDDTMELNLEDKGRQLMGEHTFNHIFSGMDPTGDITSKLRASLCYSHSASSSATPPPPPQQSPAQPGSSTGPLTGSKAKAILGQSPAVDHLQTASPSAAASMHVKPKPQPPMPDAAHMPAVAPPPPPPYSMRHEQHGAAEAVSEMPEPLLQQVHGIAQEDGQHRLQSTSEGVADRPQHMPQQSPGVANSSQLQGSVQHNLKQRRRSSTPRKLNSTPRRSSRLRRSCTDTPPPSADDDSMDISDHAQHMLTRLQTVMQTSDVLQSNVKRPPAGIQDRECAQMDGTRRQDIVCSSGDEQLQVQAPQTAMPASAQDHVAQHVPQQTVQTRGKAQAAKRPERGTSDTQLAPGDVAPHCVDLSGKAQVEADRPQQGVQIAEEPRIEVGRRYSDRRLSDRRCSDVTQNLLAEEEDTEMAPQVADHQLPSQVPLSPSVREDNGGTAEDAAATREPAADLLSSKAVGHMTGDITMRLLLEDGVTQEGPLARLKHQIGQLNGLSPPDTGYGRTDSSMQHTGAVAGGTTKLLATTQTMLGLPVPSLHHVATSVLPSVPPPSTVDMTMASAVGRSFGPNKKQELHLMEQEGEDEHSRLLDEHTMDDLDPPPELPSHWTHARGSGSSSMRTEVVAPYSEALLTADHAPTQQLPPADEPAHQRQAPAATTAGRATGSSVTQRSPLGEADTNVPPASRPHQPTGSRKAGTATPIAAMPDAHACWTFTPVALAPQAPTQPLNFQEFLKAVDVSFLDHMRRGTSINFADFGTDPPPTSLADCYQLLCITTALVAEYQAGIKTLQEEVKQRKERIAEKEQELNGSNPQIFHTVQIAGLEELERIKHDVTKLKKACRASAEASLKEWRGDSKAHTGMKLKHNLQLIQQDHVFLQDTLKHVHMLAEKVKEFADQQRQDMEAKMAAHKAAVEHIKRVELMQCELQDMRTANTGREERVLSAMQHLTQLKADLSRVSLERESCSNVLRELSAQEEQHSSQCRQDEAAEDMLEQVEAMDIVLGSQGMALQNVASSKDNSEVTLRLNDTFHLRLFMTRRGETLQANGYLEMAAPDENPRLPASLRSLIISLFTASGHAVLDKFSIPTANCSQLSLKVQQYRTLTGRLNDLLSELDGLLLKVSYLAHVEYKPPGLTLSFLNLTTQAKFDACLTLDKHYPFGHMGCTATVQYPGTAAITPDAIQSCVSTVPPGFFRLSAICKALSALAASSQPAALPN